MNFDFQDCVLSCRKVGLQETNLTRFDLYN